MDKQFSGAFLDPVKLADITPVHKKEDPYDKDNYRPISILPLISKVFEKIIYSQAIKLHPAAIKSIALRIPTGLLYSA